MSTYFPRQTIVWKLEEQSPWRRLTLSVWEMALITGVVLRLFRSLALTHGDASSWAFLGGVYAVMYLFLFGMETLHLGNYTLRRWSWRAPLFGAIQAGAQIATSFALILLGREPYGSGRAEPSDWPALASNIFFSSVIPVILYALVLAGVVQMMRYWMVRAEHREGTAQAVHRGSRAAPQPAESDLL